MGSVTIIFFITLKKGHFIPASAGLLLSLWSILISASHLTGGLRSPVLIGSIITILIATMILGGQWGLFFAFLNIGAVIYFKSAGVDESTGPPAMGVTDQFYALGLSSVFFVTALIMMAACYTITRVIQRIKQAEELADTHSETAKLYFDFTSAMMIRLDKHGHLQIMNRIACTFFGCSNEDMTSLPFIDFIENDEQKNIFRTCLESLQKQDADSESII
ncbi:MAG: hypothetical protein GF372_12610, partial [Candidatus Marinimicrobia bacterium]|nr:hypothetical protein [Candidatus Neomarinimicrobiota bacterium]